MVVRRKLSISSLSVTESEHFYTPAHSYNTRLSAKVFKNQENLPTTLNFRRSSTDETKNERLIEQFENSSDRFSVASSYCLRRSPERFSESEDRNYCDEYLRKSLVKFQKPMDCIDPPFATDRTKWIKNGSIVLVVVFVGWYVNNLRLQFANIKADIDSINGRISDIVDARLDTLYKLSEIGNTVKELKQSQGCSEMEHEMQYFVLSFMSTYPFTLFVKKILEHYEDESICQVPIKKLSNLIRKLKHNFRFTIQKMIEDEISKMYSDKTGRTDFALESAGGRIVRISPGTENYGQQKSYLGISLCEGMHGPRAMIQTGTSPGKCWALKGSSGGVIVKLLAPVKIDAVSMEHISKNISPSGDSKTAPKDFTVWGLKTLTDKGTQLGQFAYNINGPLVQMFPIPHQTNEHYEFIELKILSNHGHSDFTCVYRFRVHGIMET